MDVFKSLFEDMEDEVSVRSLQETMTRSDLPFLLLGDNINVALLKEYREYPADWQSYVTADTVEDFRQATRIYEFGGDGMLNEVDEQAPYEYAAIDEGRYQFAVAKYGRKFGISWEAYKNDRLAALRRLPKKLARAARRTEARLVTQLLCDAGGPNAALFDAHTVPVAYDNIGAGALSVANLTAAFQVIGNAVDANDEPVYFENVHLVVPPALEITARTIINATELQYPESTTTANQQVKWRTANWLRNRIQLHVNPHLPLINAANGNTAWYLIPDQNDVTTMIFARLRGHEEPEIFMKHPNASRIGGGEDPFQGDFDHDSIEYKLRHCVGAATADYLGSYASTGV